MWFRKSLFGACMLQYVVVCCSVWQRVAACCSVLQWYCRYDFASHFLVCVCCSVSQCVAVCCSVLILVCRGFHTFLVYTCCSVLQFVALCLSVLQCVAVCCSVLQCVAVCWVSFVGRSCLFFTHVLYYGVATISRLLKIVSLCCKRAL